MVKNFEPVPPTILVPGLNGEPEIAGNWPLDKAV
jgi:hypothetical protein